MLVVVVVVVVVLPVGSTGETDGPDNGALVVGRNSKDGIKVVGDTTGSCRVDGRIVVDGWDDTGATDDGNVRSIRTT